MIELLQDNRHHEYRLYRSQIVVDQFNAMVGELNQAVDLFREAFPGKDTTWTYKYYNAFSLTAPSRLFYQLLVDVKTAIREHIGDDRPLWIQSWINYHQPDQLLGWHYHQWQWHGYICIDPKKSKTLFEQYEIENQVGNIYIGPGYRNHKVQALENFSTPRITLGFDVTDIPKTPRGHFSLMPI